jgi:glutathione S-transferase
VVETAQWEFQTALKLFSEGLGDNDFILGNDFTAADILLGHCLFWGLAFKQSIEQENLKAYLGRVGARPALVAARKRESSALPGE